MPEPHTGQETIYLPTAGPLAGFPGASHGPGLVLLDWDARTVTPVQPAQSVQLTVSGESAGTITITGTDIVTGEQHVDVAPVVATLEPAQEEAQPAPAEQVPPEDETVTS